jgi:hypothetical protein
MLSLLDIDVLVLGCAKPGNFFVNAQLVEIFGNPSG